MKKSLLIISFFCLLFSSIKAQITITSADVAAPGQIVYQATDTLPSISVGTASTVSQSWNFSSLAQPINDTLSFLAYSSAPNPNYPTSNLVVKQGWQNNFGYAVNNASQLSLLGNSGIVNLAGFPTTVNQICGPPEKLATFPLTLNSNFTNNYRTHAKFYFGHTVPVGANSYQVDSIREYGTVHKTVVVDAWGQLTTPLGQFNVIRSKETKITHDTIDAYVNLGLFGLWQNFTKTADSTTSYVYWANGVGFTLVTATMDSAGAVANVKWLKALPAGISETNSSDYELVYPNPAENEINFIADASKQKEIKIYDIAGRMIDSYTVSANQTTINTSSFANGIYMYKIIGRDNNISSKGKFSISK